MMVYSLWTGAVTTGGMLGGWMAGHALAQAPVSLDDKTTITFAVAAGVIGGAWMLSRKLTHIEDRQIEQGKTQKKQTEILEGLACRKGSCPESFAPRGDLER